METETEAPAAPVAPEVASVIPSPAPLPPADVTGEVQREPIREATTVEAGGGPLEGPGRRLSTSVSAGSAPYHFKHRPTMLGRLKSIGHKAKELAGGRESPTPGSPSFNPRRASMSCRPRIVPPLVIEEEPEDLALRERPSIKVRLCTFNMHDDLPHGDLSGFLGEVKGWRRRNANLATTAPTADSSTANDSVFSIPAPAGLPQFPLTPGHPYHIIVVAGQECPTASGVLAGKIRTLDGFGWTSVLESWLCGGPEKDEGDSSDSDGEEEGDTNSTTTGGEAASVKSKATGSGGGTVVGETGRGPYVLVEKERLMGIYLAVFVAESCDGFINGTSKDRVTAGLIGGRLGNKGGVGISLSFAGSRLLFISAHLAAHASALEIRKANVVKILSELKVDDFTGRDQSAVPLTDRFDQCFFLGDLNMRLNLSRLHADWISKTRDWHIAMEFDQLGEVLRDPESCLKGFQEAPIEFAPTYKYDVPPKIKKKRSGGFRTPRASKRSSKTLESTLSTTSSATSSDTPPSHMSPSHASAGELFPPPKDMDALSIISSQGSDMSDYDKIDRSDLNGLGLPALPDSTVEAVRRAQVRFMTLVRSSSNNPGPLRRIGESSSPGSRKSSAGQSALVPALAARPILRSTQSEAAISKSGVEIAIETEDDDDDRDTPEAQEPAFDSSAKQRVQSYTDRILFKSNVAQQSLPEVPTSPGMSMVDSFRNLLQPSHSLPTPTPETSRPLALHSYFDERPALDSPSKKIIDHKTERPWSDVASVSGEPRHHRFANWFGRGHRRGIASRSTESLASPNSDDATTPSRALSRTKSLHHIRRVSLAPSIAPSVATTRSFGGFNPIFWRRPSATETLASPHAVDPFAPGPPLETPRRTALSRTSSRGSLGEVSSVSSPHRHSTAETTPASSHRKGAGLPWSTTVEVPKLDRAPPPRRRSLFDTPSTPSLIPRTLTRASQALRNPSGSSRFKSFLHSIPLPFLHHTNSRTPTAEDLSPIPTPKPKPQRIGPRRGAIEVLAYDAVVDLARMGAVSDHRPVFAVLAIGIGSEYE